MKVKELLQGYWAAIEDGGRRSAIVVHFAIPVAFGAIALIPSRVDYVPGIMAAVALIAGLLFSMLVLLIDIRGRVRRGEDPRAMPGDRATTNLDYAYSAANYTIVIGFALTGLLLVGQRLPDCMPDPWPLVKDWVAYALIAHFAAAALHCLRRLGRCYETFGKGNR